jgi:hypothetical protein
VEAKIDEAESSWSTLGVLDRLYGVDAAKVRKQARPQDTSQAARANKRSANARGGRGQLGKGRTATLIRAGREAGGIGMLVSVKGDQAHLGRSPTLDAGVGTYTKSKCRNEVL